MSRIDRFLVSHNFFNLWPSASVTALGKVIYDHCPLLLKVGLPDLGPKPFKILDHWLGLNDFCSVVETSRNSMTFSGSADIRLKKKLKNLNVAIKNWNSVHSTNQTRRKESLYKSITDWDCKAEVGLLTDVDLNARDSSIFELLQLEQIDSDVLR